MSNLYAKKASTYTGSRTVPANQADPTHCRVIAKTHGKQCANRCCKAGDGLVCHRHLEHLDEVKKEYATKVKISLAHTKKEPIHEETKEPEAAPPPKVIKAKHAPTLVTKANPAPVVTKAEPAHVVTNTPSVPEICESKPAHVVTNTPSVPEIYEATKQKAYEKLNIDLMSKMILADYKVDELTKKLMDRDQKVEELTQELVQVNEQCDQKVEELTQELVQIKEHAQYITQDRDNLKHTMLLVVLLSLFIFPLLWAVLWNN